MIAPFVIEPLTANHDRLGFSCGVEALDRYLQTQASQDIRRRIANCFVAVASDAREIAGYYTLSAASIPITELSGDLAKKLPRYSVIPAALIGRLAVDRRFAGRSLGSTLLFDAISRVLRAEPAVFALIVDAKDENAARFYRHFGFRSFVNRHISLFLPMATAAKLTGIAS